MVFARGLARTEAYESMKDVSSGSRNAHLHVPILEQKCRL